MSSRANIPARRPVSTISPATAFCNSLRQATVVKSAARSTAQRVPASACCTRSAPGRSGSVRRGVARNQTEASASRCAGNQTTDGSTVAPPVKGANCWRCSTPFCSTHTTMSGEHRAVSQGAMASVWVVFTATKTRSKGAAIAIGSVYTGPGTTISPSSVRSTSAEWAVRPQTIGALPLSNRAAAIVVPMAPGPISATLGNAVMPKTS